MPLPAGRVPPVSRNRRDRLRRQAGFTLLEVVVALTILMVATTLAMGAYIAALKRATHSQNTLQGTTQVRYASDFISEAVRSAPVDVIVQAGGTQLVVAPKDLGYATVLATTWIDVLHSVKGSKANQRMLHISNVVPSGVSRNVFTSAARPAGAVSTGDVATYFSGAGSLPTVDLNDLFAVGDTIKIPATAYGAETTGVINNISNNPGNKTLTLDANLGVDVPNGTRILATGGRRMLFSVEASGDLRFYPDRRDMTKFIVLARDIDPQPRVNPSNNASARTVPFALTARELQINLQHLPRGTTAGRTVQGVQTRVFTRTDPLVQ